jgi:hypothetical protein
VATNEPLTAGVAGVMASVATLITGAAGDGGFKGLGGQYSRRNLLLFGVSGITGLAFTRVDTNVTVDCVLRLNFVPADPRMGQLLPTILQGHASPDETRLFGQLWQDRVRRILIEHGDDPALVEIQRCATTYKPGT